MDSKTVESIRQTVMPSLISQGLELVDIEYLRESGGWTLRLFIDKEGGITLDDCTSVSHQIGDLITAKGIINQPYTLEVSSPGLNRPLKNVKDFELVVGREVKIKTHKPIQGRKNFKGVLIAYSHGIARISVDFKNYDIPLSDIVRANLVYNFDVGG